MDIIVTTPKSEMTNAAMEAASCLKDKGGYYFRRFYRPFPIKPGARVYFVEDGFIRGFGIVYRMHDLMDGKVCSTTGKKHLPGYYIFMRADSWKWIKPIPMKGFQGYRYATKYTVPDPKVIGGWKDPKPKIK